MVVIDPNKNAINSSSLPESSSKNMIPIIADTLIIDTVNDNISTAMSRGSHFIINKYTNSLVYHIFITKETYGT